MKLFALYKTKYKEINVACESIEIYSGKIKIIGGPGDGKFIKATGGHIIGTIADESKLEGEWKWE